MCWMNVYILCYSKKIEAAFSVDIFVRIYKTERYRAQEKAI